MVDGVVAVVDEFGLDDGDDAGFLALISIFSEDVTVGGDGGIGGGEEVTLVVEANFKGGAPFGETEAHLVVFVEAIG